jgi:hypothetical protein
MDEMEVKKICCFCGADVTHTERHKNRYGKYVCMTCHKSKKHSSRHRSHGAKARDYRRILMYVIFAAAGSWMFYKLLEIFSQSDN